MKGNFPLSELPAAGTIHVWWIDLDAGLKGTGGEGLMGFDPDALLSAEERKRAARFHFDRDASRFRLCRAMLRLGLGWYLGRRPGEIALSAGRFGKPYLAGAPGLFFNVAHSAGLAAIAFTALGEVGIDVEAAHRTVEAMEIASAYFTRNEAVSIASAASQAAQVSAFLRIWTRKEAVLKAAGYGIAQGLDRLDVLGDLVSLPGEMAGSGSLAKTSWQVRDLPRVDGFWGAIAAAPGDWPIVEWNLDWGELAARFQARFPGALDYFQ